MCHFLTIYSYSTQSTVYDVFGRIMIHIKQKSKETERDEIKEETHELGDEAQNESEGEDVEEQN